MQAAPKDVGWLEVICGPMFSGKTEELIRRLRRALYARQTVAIFKPAIDTRYAELELVSHSKLRLEAKPVKRARQIYDLIAPGTHVVGIDEVQFFEAGVVEVAQDLANRGVRVIVAGLDQDYRGAPFGPMPQLLTAAEFVTKTLAICMVCGNPAGRSQRLVRAEGQVVLGATEAYEARCRKCHRLDDVPMEQPRLFA